MSQRAKASPPDARQQVLAGPMSLHGAPLGSRACYVETYSPDLLYPIARAQARHALGIEGALPFGGVDLWTGHELSWLDPHGKPQVAAMSLAVPADSPYLVESKSLKLYLNSLNQTPFASPEELRHTLVQDLGAKAGCTVDVALVDEPRYLASSSRLDGELIDGIEAACCVYQPDAALLATDDTWAEETLRSDLLKSNCPVTGQPDWAGIMVRYRGPKIRRDSLLRYIVSYRRHSGFHEQCVEKIFVDLKDRCRCEQLTVYARYTRRGGLDINPFRSDFEEIPRANLRTFRQ